MRVGGMDGWTEILACFVGQNKFELIFIMMFCGGNYIQACLSLTHSMILCVMEQQVNFLKSLSDARFFGGGARVLLHLRP